MILRGNPYLTLRTDASGLGWGAQLNDNGTCVETGGRWEGNELELHINAQELMAVQLSLKALCKNYRNCHIRIESDNATNVCYLNEMGGSKSRICNSISKEIWLWCIDKRIWISLSHIAGCRNIIEDRRSRVFNDTTEWKLNPVIFEKIHSIYHEIEIDFFASRLNC